MNGCLSTELFIVVEYSRQEIICLRKSGFPGLREIVHGLGLIT